MTLYEQLNISGFIGQNVRIALSDGVLYEGILDLDCLNEDWEEDGEPEMIALDIRGMLECIILSEIKSIELIEITTV